MLGHGGESGVGFGEDGSVRRFSLVSAAVVWVTAFFFLAGSSIWAQESSGERIFFHAKVFTGDPQNPYAEAVAIRGRQDRCGGQSLRRW